MERRTTWTRQENKMFENALAIFTEDEPDFYQNLAKAVGNKTIEEVQEHYERLLHDIALIESGQISLPNYKPMEGSTQESKVKEDKELR